MREWLVIESARKHAVFTDEPERSRKGYIPRDVVEGDLGIKIEPDGRHTWFSREQLDTMHAHPE